MMSRAVYLDHNATTQLDPQVIKTIETTLTDVWANPSSGHDYGKMAKACVRTGRTQTAACIGAKASEIVFTSGGTESNNTVIYSALEDFRAANPDTLPHVVTSNIEHDSVELMLAELERTGRATVTRVPVDATCFTVTRQNVVAALQPSTCLVTLMLANNETGVIQPIRDIFAGVREHVRTSKCFPIRLHTDAAQIIGKRPVNVHDLDADYLTIVGHKFYGPRVGALYVKRLGEPDSPSLNPLLFGGGQERGFRPGTENVPMIAGLGAACQLIADNLSEYEVIQEDMREFLLRTLQDTFGAENIVVNGSAPTSEILPNTLNFSIMSREETGRQILEKAKHVVMASVGSACHAHGEDSPSKVLLAVGVPEDQARRAMRWSVGRQTTRDDITTAVAGLYTALTKAK
eukprot:m.364567 g.364567  ORF g.364567 m.364567 type:complete len:404 (+) comp27624_c0_seq1:46-1257(+)